MDLANCHTNITVNVNNNNNQTTVKKVPKKQKFDLSQLEECDPVSVPAFTRSKTMQHQLCSQCCRRTSSVYGC